MDFLDSILHANRSAITEVGTLLKQHMLVLSPTIPLHSIAWLKGAGENNLKMQQCQLLCQAITVRWNPRHVVTALKIAPTLTKWDNPILHETEHNKGKCALFYCCFVHYRKLAYKISACEVCIICRKPTEAFKNPSRIAESRTRKPEIVTLKIQLQCSTVHYTTLWANIFVRSHLKCGTDSVSIRFFAGLTNISKTQKQCK